MIDSTLLQIARNGVKAGIVECSQNSGQSSAFALALLEESLTTIRDLFPETHHLLGQVLGEYVTEADEKPDALYLLQKYGANMDWRNGDGYTVLQVAVKAGSEDRVRALCGAGADINAAYHSGNASGTTLQLAMQPPKIEMVELLLELGADANATDPHTGESPIERAARRSAASVGSPDDRKKEDENSWALIETLIGWNAHLLDEGSTGLIPLQLALTSKATERVVLLLLNNEAYNNEDHLDYSLLEAVKLDYCDAIRALVKEGANPCVELFGCGLLEHHPNAKLTTVELINSLITEREVSASLGTGSGSEVTTTAHTKALSPI
jgi:hypothetical protein